MQINLNSPEPEKSGPSVHASYITDESIGVAEELGMKGVFFPQKSYKQVENAIHTIITEIFPQAKSLQTLDFEVFFEKNWGSIFSIFNAVDGSWRLPSMITRSMVSPFIENQKEALLFFAKCLDYYIAKSFQLDTEDIDNEMKKLSNRPLSSLVLPKKIAQVILNEKMKAFYFFMSEQGSRSIECGFQDQARDTMLENENMPDAIIEALMVMLETQPLPPEIVLVHFRDFITKKNPGMKRRCEEILVPKELQALNFWICQTHIEGYEFIIRSLFAIEHCFPVWAQWFEIYGMSVFDDAGSSTLRSLSRALGLCEKSDTKNTTSLGVFFSTTGKNAGQPTPKFLKKISPLLGNFLMERPCQFQKNLHKNIRKHGKMDFSTTKVQQEKSLAIANIVQSKNIPTPNIIIPKPVPEKTQLLSIDLTGLNLPAGTKITLQRKIIRSNRTIFEDNISLVESNNNLTGIVGADYKGLCNYTLDIILPAGCIFEGTQKQTFTVSNKWYIEAPLTGEEEMQAHTERQKFTSKSNSDITSAGIPKIPSQVEAIISPAVDTNQKSLEMLELILQEYQEAIIADALEKYAGDKTITLDLSSYGADFSELILGHHIWILGDNNDIQPTCENDDIRARLVSIYQTVREQYQHNQALQKQNNDRKIREEQEQKNIATYVAYFLPLLQYAENINIGDISEGDFLAQKDKFINKCKEHGFVVFKASNGRQMTLRHKENGITIMYLDGKISVYCTKIAGDVKNHTPLQTALLLIAKKLADMVAFFMTEKTSEDKVIRNNLKKKFSEMRAAALVYQERLEAGKARLVLFGSDEESGHDHRSSRFPGNSTPCMMNELCGVDTIEALMTQNPHARCCFRRDGVVINGELDGSSGEASVDTVHDNWSELKASPRARYILKKRILITLNLEKFPDDTDRASITHGKNHKLRDTTARSILDDMVKEKQISSPDIDDTFLDTYIEKLQQVRIRVHYSWPISATFDEYKALLKQQKKPT